MAVAAETLPRWDLTPFFPVSTRASSRPRTRGSAPTSPGWPRCTTSTTSAAATRVELDDEMLAAFEEVHRRDQRAADQLRLVNAYVHALRDHRRPRRPRRRAASRSCSAQAAPLRTLSSRFDAWVARFGADAPDRGEPGRRRPRVAAAQGRARRRRTR